MRPSALPILPIPLHAVARPGTPLPLGAGTRVVAVGEAEAVGSLVAAQLGAFLGQEVPVVHDDGRPGAVVLRLLSGGAGASSPGAYRIQVDSVRALVTAVDVDGLRHGAATLRQLVVSTPDGGRGLRPAFVVDAPRFSWRGLLLDVARSFVPVETVERVLDVLAGLRMNVLHLHLTDDQGWRLEIPSRPLLTEVSGRTAVEGGRTGWYTAADYERIQRYAAARGITVIPEIDLPGHVGAALHAYGELNPDGVPAPVLVGTDVSLSRLYPELPGTMPFVRDVLADVAAMTHGPYLHIGGDDAYAMSRAEYAHTVAAIAEQVRIVGKTAVGWQEVTKTPLAPGTVVQLRDDRPDTSAVIDAAWQGARVLISPAQHVYLGRHDLDAGEPDLLDLALVPPIGIPGPTSPADAVVPPADWARSAELRYAYDFEPMEYLPGLLPGAIAGVEAVLTTEQVRTDDDLFGLLLPRLAAVAEAGWSVPPRRSWPDFAVRVARYSTMWDLAGLPWHGSARTAG